MRKMRLLWLTAACCVMLAGCQPSKAAKTAREEGIAYLEQKDYGAALAAFETALYEADGVVSKFHLDVLKYRAEAEYGVGDFAAAAHTYGVLMEADKELPEYLNLRSMCKAAEGRWEEALADYEKAVTIDPKAPFSDQALLTTGQAVETAGEFGKAAELYQNAIASGKQSPALYNRMGLNMLGQKDYTKALEYFDTGLSMEGAEGKAQLQFNQAVAYEYMGDFPKALTLMEAFVAEHGSTPEAEKEIAFLKTR